MSLGSICNIGQLVDTVENAYDDSNVEQPFGEVSLPHWMILVVALEMCSNCPIDFMTFIMLAVRLPSCPSNPVPCRGSIRSCASIHKTVILIIAKKSAPRAFAVCNEIEVNWKKEIDLATEMAHR